nr:MAG TPA: hypothetical protein [Caudoviricetes sp.]
MTRRNRLLNKTVSIRHGFSFDLSDVVKLGKFSPLDVKQRSFKHEFET